MSSKSFLSVTLFVSLFAVSNCYGSDIPKGCVKLSGAPLVNAKRAFQEKMLAATGAVNKLKAQRDNLKDFQKSYVESQVPQSQLDALSTQVAEQQKILDQGISCNNFPKYGPTLKQLAAAIEKAQHMIQDKPVKRLRTSRIS